MKFIKKYLAFIMVLALTLGLCACSNVAKQSENSTEGRTVTDMSGTEVTLPETVDK